MKKFNFISLKRGVIVKITLLFCMFYLQNSFAQWCGSHHVTDRLITQNLGGIIYDRPIDEISNRNIGGPYIIPVVWHVVKGSNNLGEVSDATITQYMTYLNSKFQNALGGTSISFQLARIDKDGYCTTGINRYENVAQPWGSRWDPNVDHSLKSRRWPVSKYLNIYTVVDMVANSSGTPDPTTSAYTPLICSPTKPSVTYSMTCLVPDGGNLDFNIEDGVVLRYNELNSLFHEVGHWTGLFHVYAPDTYDSQINWWTFCGTGTQNGDFINITNPMIPTLVSAPCTSNSCGGTDPKDNLMSSSTGCWPSNLTNLGFVTEQGNRIKSILDNNRTIIHSPANLLATGAGTFKDNTILNIPDVWTTTTLPNGGNVRAGNIVINNGATLYINAGVNITMCRNSTITINPGGKLILNGSTITATNPGWWNGIKLIPGTNSNVANLEANGGSMIKNAIIGVECNNNTGLNFTCLVKTNGATFLDNEIGIALKSSVNRDFGILVEHVKNTTFTNNLSSGFQKFIELERVNEFTVKGCTLTNNVPKTTLALNGIGIHSKSSGLTTCIEFPTYADCGNTFSGFADGVLIETPGTQRFFKVTKNTISNTVYHVRVVSTNTGKITHNTFNLSNTPINNNSQSRFGVHITGANTATSIQENTFTCAQFSPAQLGPIRTGVFHDGTGNVTKYVRKNTFKNMTHGVKAQNTNAINSGTITGLTYTCNKNNPVTNPQTLSERDIFPQSGANTVCIEQKGIEIVGGNPQNRATGNTFYNSGPSYRSIENLMTPIINYRRRDPATFPTENPVNSVNINVVLDPTVNCAIEEYLVYPTGPLNSPGQGSRNDTEVDEWNASLIYFLENRAKLNDDYLNNFNNWKEDQLLDYYDRNSNNEIAIDIFSSKLLNYYLSETVEDHRESVLNLIKSIDKYSSMVWLLKEYASNQKWDEADRLIADIFASPRHIEYEDLLTVLDVYEVIKGKDILADDDVAKIKSIADTYRGNGAWWAQNIMSTMGRVYYPKEGEAAEEVFKHQQQPESRAIKQNGMVLFPNPTKDLINLVLSSDQYGSQIIVSGLDGKILFSKNSNIGRNEIDVSILNSGIFLIEVKRNKEILFKSKFIKQ